MVVEPQSATVFVGTRISKKDNDLLKALTLRLKLNSKEDTLKLSIGNFLRDHADELIKIHEEGLADARKLDMQRREDSFRKSVEADLKKIDEKAKPKSEPPSTG